GGANFQFDTLRQWHLVPVQSSGTSNVYVDTLYLENPFVVGGEKNTIRVRLRNDGEHPVEGLVVKLTINGVQAATTSATLEPGSPAEVGFDINTGLSGLNSSVINFNDFPAAFDNEFFFTLNFSRPVRVLEIRQSPGETFVGKVFGN